MIDIYHNNGDGTAATLRATDLHIERSVSAPPIAKPRQFIELRKICQLLSGFLKLGIFRAKRLRESSHIFGHSLTFKARFNHLTKRSANAVTQNRHQNCQAPKYRGKYQVKRPRVSGPCQPTRNGY